jgi:hypothetical protein
VDLAFVGLSLHLREKMEGQEFLDVNQVLQWAVLHENRAKDHRSRSRFKESSSRETQNVNMVDDDESTSDSDTLVCVTEWVDTPRDRPVMCLFLKVNTGEKEEVKYKFDVSKCDKFFDVLLRGG